MLKSYPSQRPTVAQLLQDTYVKTCLRGCETRLIDGSFRQKRQREREQRSLLGRTTCGTGSDTGNVSTSEPPPNLVCPITQELLRHPVSTPYGHTFERKVRLSLKVDTQLLDSMVD